MNQIDTDKDENGSNPDEPARQIQQPSFSSAFILFICGGYALSSF